jgi:ABC-type Mn2+/Zn2+ transport system permease subunit
MFTMISDVASYFEMELGQIAAAGTLFVSILSGLLSPAVVLKEKSYVGDLVAHYVFPGVVAGYFLSESFGVPMVPALFLGAIVSALAGTFVADFIHKSLRIPGDAASVVTLTGFFGLGVVAVSKLKGTRVDLHSFLFGNILGLTWTDVALVGLVAVCAAVLLIGLRRDWEAWICDPEFARIAGFRVQLLERVFPVLLTFAVLVSLFAVGALMVSALLTLPSLLLRSRRVVSVGPVFLSIVVGGVGLVLALAFDWPVGSAIVVLGLCLVIGKAVVLRTFRHS